MKVAVVGGGFTGLAAAYELTKHGAAVTLFESSPVLGGLAHGFRQPDWKWHLEYSYHHWFTNDRAVLTLIKELGLEDKLIIKRPITANYVPNSKLSFDSLKGANIFQLDSPKHLFLFPGLSILNKFRTAALLGFLKLDPFWKPLENITAEHFLTSIGGRHSYAVLWEPLLVGKFGDYAPKIQAAWFWARIKKRTPNLMYMEGGFKTLIDALESAIKKQGGKILLNTQYEIPASPAGRRNTKYDKILLTVPTPIAQKIFPEITPPAVPHRWAQTRILETEQPILKDVYWLNITDRSYPFLAAVAHTNFMDKKYYGGHHLTYFGNYLPEDHKYLSMTKEKLLEKFLPFIQRLNPHTKYDIRNTFLFTAPFAQPVHELHYSSRSPKLETAVPDVYLANMDSIVPWDRGTNYAIALGQKAAAAITSKHI